MIRGVGRLSGNHIRYVGFAIVLFLLFVFLVSYMVSQGQRTDQYKPTNNLNYSAAAYTVTRTYTSRYNVLINNLWKQTQDIKGGIAHACALSNGKVFCWGRNESGQLGNGTTNNSSNPVQATGALSNKYVTAIAVGGRHSCALAEGRAFCWGANGSGRLGNGPNNGAGGANSGITNQLSPVAVDTSASSAMGTKNVTSIVGGGYHTCAIAENQAYCWGRNGEGQLGNSSPVNPNLGQPSSNSCVGCWSIYPAAISGGSSSVTSIATGSNHTCAVAAGTAYCWGGVSNTCPGGRLGNGVGGCSANVNAPVAVRANNGDQLYQKVVTSVAAGASHSCAIAEGKAYCWGYNAAGELGDGTTTSRTTPVAVSTSGASTLPSSAIVENISTGVYTDTDNEYQTCAVAEGKAYCWGDNTYGQLGNGVTGTDSSYPVTVSSAGVLSGKYVTEVTPGSPFACAIANGRAYCWGKNDYGQLGNGTTTNINVPYRVNDSYY